MVHDTHRSMAARREEPEHLVIKVEISVRRMYRKMGIPENKMTNVKKMGTSKDATKALGAIAASI